MERPSLDPQMLRSFRASCASMVKDFALSPLSFKLVRTVSQEKLPLSINAKSLYVLDSSFNPPTKAHHRIAVSALLNDPGPMPKRLLLLLATENADKAKMPAALEDRLVMMTLFAHEILYDLRQGADLSIDVGLIRQPYFHDKAAALDESAVYPEQTQQVHLIGFDTLIRIFNAKYYPPAYNLQILESFLSKHRLRATYRTENKWGNRHEQDQYVQDIADGKRNDDGAQPGWARQLVLVEGKRNGEDIISSTFARTAARNDPSQLDKYVMPSIKEWIISKQLYLEDDL